MTILSAGVIGLLAGFSLSIRAGSRAMHLQEAVTIAENQLALSITQAADRLTPSAGSSGQYEWEVAFEDKEGALKEAAVVVAWLERGQEQTFRLSRIFLPLAQDQEAP